MRGLCGSVGSSCRGAGITDFVSLVMLSKVVLQWFPLRTGARAPKGGEYIKRSKAKIVKHKFCCHAGKYEPDDESDREGWSQNCTLL